MCGYLMILFGHPQYHHFGILMIVKDKDKHSYLQHTVVER